MYLYHTCIHFDHMKLKLLLSRYLYSLTLCGQLFAVWMVLVGLPFTMLNSILFKNPLWLNYCQANTSEWNICPETFVVVAPSWLHGHSVLTAYVFVWAQNWLNWFFKPIINYPYMYAEHLSSFLHASLDCYQIQHNHCFKKIDFKLTSVSILIIC